MSATLVSSNTTIKVNGAISAGNATGSNNGTLYTAPANGYAIVQYYKAGGTTSVSPRVSGRQVGLALTTEVLIYNIYVGPSQSFTWTGSGVESIANVINITGVEYINTP